MKRKAFTLVEMLIVLIVIGILTAIMIFSSTEMIITAKAQTIANNLIALKMATKAWAKDNADKIQVTADSQGSPRGQVTIGGKTSPVQEWSDNDLKISQYMDNTNATKFNLSTTSHSGGKQNTNLEPGCYGICDGGTTKGYRRNYWYAGYTFKDNEDAVKEKLKKRSDSYNLIFADNDVHTTNSDKTVWMLIFDIDNGF